MLYCSGKKLHNELESSYGNKVLGTASKRNGDLPVPQVVLELLCQRRGKLKSSSWQTLLSWQCQNYPRGRKSSCQVLTASRCTCVSVSQHGNSANHCSLSHSVSSYFTTRSFASATALETTGKLIPSWNNFSQLGEGEGDSNELGAVVHIQQKKGRDTSGPCQVMHLVQLKGNFFNGPGRWLAGLFISQMGLEEKYMKTKCGWWVQRIWNDCKCLLKESFQLLEKFNN